MNVTCLTSTSELSDIFEDWNRLADSRVLQQWQWLLSWHEAFADRGDLYVLVVRDEDRIVGLAPWVRCRSVSGGRVIRPLGHGRACTEYQGILADELCAKSVCEALAAWLADASHSADYAWDQLDLDANSSDDQVMTVFCQCLEALGQPVVRRDDACCWHLDLPSDWEGLLARFSRGGLRRKLRLIERDYVKTGRASLRLATSMNEVQEFYQQMVEFHQRRWQAAGEDGCFADPCFERFVLLAAERFFEAGQLRMVQVQVDGQPAAAAMAIQADCDVSVYQCGMNLDLEAHQPGWLLNALHLKDLIETGFKRCDFLRGNERYKMELRCDQVSQYRLLVAAPHSVGRMRHQVWMTQDRLRHWGRQVKGAMRRGRTEP